MATVFDVAQYILAKYGSLEAMKLQKLVFYSQAWHIVQTDAPMFNEPVKAYEKGPVVGRLFYRHKGFRHVTPALIEIGDADALTFEQAELVDSVLSRYGSMTSDQLSDLTHEESPWSDAWAMRKWDDVISPTAMQSFYASQLVFERHKAPRLPCRTVMHVDSRSLKSVLDSLDEPDDFRSLLESVGQARLKLGV